jgi:hypothetical protein
MTMIVARKAHLWSLLFENYILEDFSPTAVEIRTSEFAECICNKIVSKKFELSIFFFDEVDTITSIFRNLNLILSVALIFKNYPAGPVIFVASSYILLLMERY